MDGSSTGSVCGSVGCNVALTFAVAKWFCGIVMWEWMGGFTTITIITTVTAQDALWQPFQ